jgi:hypothetical protein
LKALKTTAILRMRATITPTLKSSPTAIAAKSTFASFVDVLDLLIRFRSVSEPLKSLLRLEKKKLRKAPQAEAWGWSFYLTSISNSSLIFFAILR